MSDIALKVEKRDRSGKQLAKKLRKDGNVPGIYYGRAEESVPFSVDVKELETLLHSGGRTSVINLIIGRKRSSIPTIIKEIQRNPITGDLLHLDLMHVSLTEDLEVQIPVHTVGEPEGVTNEGGVLQHLVHELTLRCLPTEIPDHIEIDVSHLSIGDSIHVEDLLQKDERITTDSDTTVVSVLPPTVIKVEEEEEVEEEEILEEPELVGRGPREEEEEQSEEEG